MPTALEAHRMPLVAGCQFRLIVVDGFVAFGTFVRWLWFPRHPGTVSCCNQSLDDEKKRMEGQE